MPAFPVEVGPAKDLTPEERAVEQRAIENLKGNLPRLVEEYRNKYGTEIGTDNARDIVSPDYAESLEAATRWSRAVQRPAAALADYLFEEELNNPDQSKANIVLMTAGGTGAGKTTVLRSLPELASDSQFVYDSNLGSKRSSVEKIDTILRAGNEVRIIFVHRDPVEALTNGVLPRAAEEGRVVGLDAHARLYRDAVENLRYLARRFAADRRVQFVVFDNTGGPGQGRLVGIECLAGIRYSTTELLPRLRSALEEEYAQGRISGAVYRATLGSPTPKALGGVARNRGPEGAGADSSSPAEQGARGDAG